MKYNEWSGITKSDILYMPNNHTAIIVTSKNVVKYKLLLSGITSANLLT